MFDLEYPSQIKSKSEITSKFSSLELEELLLNSTKNVAHEVVLCLIEQKGQGVLSQISC
jgi:hypothetical protein